jgi:predicted acyltransferase
MSTTATDKRLVSLDAFRGFTIAGMLLVNNPGDWSALYPQLAHAEWHGWTFTDWIFPFFLTISGMSMILAIDAKYGAAVRSATDNRALLFNLWRRAATIVLIGLALNFVPQFDLSTLRIPGVLQRIGLCAALAAPLVVYCGWRTQLATALGLMIAYTFIQTQVSVPDAAGVWGAGRLEAGRDVGAYLDRLLLGGHLWAKAKVWDPEGLLSTAPAVSTLLLGVLIAQFMRLNWDRTETTVWLLLAGLLTLWLGAALGSVSMPINKNLWTPSYAVFMTGWALLVFGAFYWLMDACQRPAVRNSARRWLKPFTIYGMNALFLFALSGLVAKALNTIKLGNNAGEAVSLKAWLYAPMKALGLSPVNSSLLFALLFNACFFAIAYGMWKKRWFVKV